MSDEVPPAKADYNKLSISVGIVAAMVVALLLNVIVSRHYRRWDVTKGGLYTLSEATLETLHGLTEPVKVYVFLPPSSALSTSLLHLTESYRAETTELSVEVVDPDRHPAEFVSLQQKWKILAGKNEDGDIVTDAALLVLRGERPYFVTNKDLVDVDDEDDLKARPKIEQALTTAIRAVASNEKPRACFTVGHGEKADLAALKERLVKSNFEVEDAARPEAPDHDGPPDHDPLAGCHLLIVAGPSEKVPDEEVARWVKLIDKGASALVAVGPYPDGEMKRFKRLNVDALIAKAGVKLQEDFVFEQDPKLKVPRDIGEVFLATLKPHPATEAVIRAGKAGLPVVITIASSLVPTGTNAAPAALLTTSDQSFGMVDFFRWANDSAPSRSPGDHAGPLVVAYASELPKPAGSTALHGARLLVSGSVSLLSNDNWTREELRGTALFVESAIGWLTARPPLVDVPRKPTFDAGLHLSDAELTSVFRYVVVFIPLAAILIGASIYLRRRGTERRAREESS